MSNNKFIRKFAVGLFFMSTLVSCSIENDIPYPIVESAITGIRVEGQRGAETTAFEAASINNSARTVTLYVNDSVDISDMRITQLQVSNNAMLLADSTACKDYSRFPQQGFASLDSIPMSVNTRMDFSSPVKFTLRTYQDYVWTVTVNQIIQRDIDVQGMVSYVLDADSRTLIIRVGADQDLSNIQIVTLNLAGEYGEVRPAVGSNVTDVHDFTSAQHFYTRLNWEETWTDWTVFVFHSDSNVSTDASIFPMSSTASLSGTVQSGQVPVIEYREQGGTWQTLDNSLVIVTGTRYTASFTGLTPGVTYQYRVTTGGVTSSEQSFTTVRAVALENGSLENWSEGSLTSGNSYYIPNATGSNFWGTGNSATAIYRTNITTPTDDSYSGRAAELHSQSALGVKMAAGNLFAGDFQQDPESMLDGLLHFGQPFSSFPTALRLYYKYTTAPMQTVGSITQLPSNIAALVGRPDSCHIYIALSDKSEPYEIRTRASSRQLFDKNDANIIAYGEFVSATTTTTYQQITIPLIYRANRTPNYLVIVCSSSKYGDYYLAGEGSTLWLDEMELVYE